jgi:ABC-type multidrug transport system fused ATPase/permease subunit
MSADRIVVLKDGSVAETGSHEELVRQDGYYAAMVRQQTKGFLADEATEIRAA